MPNCAAIWGSAPADRATAAFEFVGNRVGHAHGDHRAAHGRERDRLEHCDPPVGRGASRGAPRPRPRRALSRAAQGSERRPSAGGCSAVAPARSVDSSSAVPISSSHAECSFSTRVVKRLAELRGDGARLFVTRRVISTHDRAKVSQVDLVDVGQRRLGTCHATPRHGPAGSICSAKPMRLFDETSGLPSAFSALVLRGDRLTHRGKTSCEELLRDRHLLGREAREQCLAVHATGAQPLGLRLRLRQRRPRAADEAGRGVRVRCGQRLTRRALARCCSPCRRRLARTGCPPVTSRALVAAVAGLATGRVRRAVVSGAVAGTRRAVSARRTIGARPRRQCRDDRLERLLRSEQLEPLGFAAMTAIGDDAAGSRCPRGRRRLRPSTMSPTFASDESKPPSTTPRGSRAPAARHVQVPSGRALVSSISIRRGIGGQT